MIASALRLPLVAAAALMGGAGAADADWRRSDTLAAFAGRMTLNVVEDFVPFPRGLEFRDSALLGIAAGQEWRREGAALSFGYEVQLLGHVGEQEHLEIALPLTLRWHLPEPAQDASLGLGLGLSYATDRPEVEIRRSGASQRMLVYWHVETEASLGPGRPSVFLRIHHRSDGYGLFDTDTGSNAVVLGLRRRW